MSRGASLTTILLISTLGAIALTATLGVWRARSVAARGANGATGRAAGPAPEHRELAASLDLAEVIERTLEEASSLPGVDAVAIGLEGADASTEMTALGMSEEEAEHVTPRTWRGHEEPSEIVYDGRSDELESLARPARPLRAGMVVPLRAGNGTVGSLAAFTRSPGARIPGPTAAALEQLARRAGPALDNAGRFARARQLADLDSLTALHNRRYFHDLLEREVARAHRYERRLALVVFDLDDFKAVNDRVGHLAGDGVLAEVADRVRGVVRSTDVACRIGGDEFGVIMPESSRDDAEQLADRIRQSVSRRPLGRVQELMVSAGVAELQNGDGPTEVFERADAALYRAKNGGKARTVTA